MRPRVRRMLFPARCHAPKTARLAGFGHMNGYDLETRSWVTADQIVRDEPCGSTAFSRVETWINHLGIRNRSDVGSVNVVDEIWRD